jgi:tRNA pseudouridine32 synthase / 23S rRNA pseudouridine746 synthase
LIASNNDFIVSKCHAQIEILHQDESILIINKPSGLLSLSGKHPLNLDSVHYRISQDFPEARLAHRLDFGTSGLMIVALNKAVNAHLTRQFQDRRVGKAYIALLDGRVELDEGLINAAIAKDKDNFPLMKLCEQEGKAAQSRFQVIKRFTQPAFTMVRFIPESGRTHQLRIHSQKIGHPILGCDLYGSTHSKAMAERLMLHASDISFEHPTSHEQVNYQCSFIAGEQYTPPHMLPDGTSAQAK